MRKNNQTGRILIKCGADAKVNNFLWRTTQMCRYFLTTSTNKVHEDKNIKQMSCYTQETGRSLLPKCSSDAKIFSSDVYKKHTQARKYQADGLQYGRSMVEMLGVLAIIGVLSVGAIAGYSKAMFKYKLNKQAEQINQLLNALYRHRASFGNNPPIMNLEPYFLKLGEIPKEMIKNNSNITDVFGSSISMSTNQCNQDNSKCSQVILRMEPLINYDIDICMNIFNVAKNLRENISYFSLGKYMQDGSYSYQSFFYGNNHCNNDRKCLSNTLITDIHEFCQFTLDAKQPSYFFTFDIKN